MPSPSPATETGRTRAVLQALLVTFLWSTSCEELNGRQIAAAGALIVQLRPARSRRG